MEPTSPAVTDTGALEQPANNEEVVVEQDENEAGLLDLSEIEINSNGTEPFWNFQASGTNLLFQDPEITENYTVSMAQTPTTLVITGSGFSALLTLDTCSDGMSDIIYDYTSVVTK